MNTATQDFTLNLTRFIRAPREKVFDAFYQVDSSSTREYGGTGLGLSIVKRIVEAHGGGIGIEENQPTGAIFVVTLPQATGSGPPPAGTH